MHTRTLLGLLLATAVVVSGCATDEPALEGTPPPGDVQPQEGTFTATLAELNGSGVSGIAEVRVEDDTQFEITIEAAGLEGAKQHPQHIHGMDEAATCPTGEADEDGDGLVAIEEGLPFYGPVAVPLAPFPSADEDGNIEFQGTFPVGDEVTPFTDRVVVLHGMTADLGEGEAYQDTLPVACGRFQP